MSEARNRFVPGKGTFIVPVKGTFILPVKGTFIGMSEARNRVTTPIITPYKKHLPNKNNAAPIFPHAHAFQRTDKGDFVGRDKAIKATLWAGIPSWAVIPAHEDSFIAAVASRKRARETRVCANTRGAEV